MPTLHRDIETFSTLDLTRCGAWRYAAEPTTGVWCVSYAIDKDPTQLWLPGNPVPDVFFEAERNPDWWIVAHNDAFERVIEELILAPRFGWPIVPIDRHRCTMAMALASALPGSLEKVAEALSLPLRKDADGARLMKMMARPRKPRRDEDPNGLYWHDDPEKIARLSNYCIRDTDVEREVYHHLPPLSDAEQALWVLDAQINARGFYTDGPLLEAASQVAAAADQAIQHELAQITDGALTSTGQVDALQAWLADHGCEVKDITKATLKHALRRKELDPAVRRVIELRRDAAHAAASKIDTMRAYRDDDGRIRGTLRFHGAGTGRWTGHGPQPQNFKRDCDDADAKCEAIATGDLGHVAALYPQPLEVVGDIARTTIRAAPGKRLLIGDFSGIESRVTAWVSEQQSKLDQWAAFDASGDPKIEPYYLIGCACGLPEEIARDVGKVADLAFGYQGGIGAWDKLAPEDNASSEADKKRYQLTWRRLHPRTAAFWNGISRMTVTAVRKPDKPLQYKRLSIVCDGDRFLKIGLPSGRILNYPFPRLKPGKFEDMVVVFKDSAAGKWTDCRFGQGAYGGLWTENIVQAISRDLLAAAMHRLEAAGYPVVLHVHDEVVCEVPIGVGSIQEFQRLLTAEPDWAAGLPIAAKVRNGERFSKSKSSKPKPAATISNPELHDDESDHTSDEVDGGDDLHEDHSLGIDEDVGAAPFAGEQLDAFLAFQAELQEMRKPQARPASHGPNGGAPRGNGADAGDEDRDDDEEADEPSPSAGYPHGEQRKGRTIATYLYRDHLGRRHTKVEKKVTRAGKQYPQSFWVADRWVARKPKGLLKIPYRLPDMLAALTATPDAAVFIPEGEKDADSVSALGLIATTSSEGATPPKAKLSNWTPELNRWFTGFKRAFILEDNDEPGRKFAREKAAALSDIVPDLRVVSFPDVPEGEDVSYWLQHGHSKEELLARCEAAPRNGGAMLQSVRASQVQMRAVQWLWKDRFALGKLGILAGLPDEGKSMLFNYITARVTGPDRYKWPEDEGEAPRGRVILLTAEDDPEDTVIPRLKAAGAGLDDVEIISMVRDRDQAGRPCERMFSLADDLELLRRKVEEVGNVRAILIDPVTAYLGKVGTIDSYRDTDVRAVLTPLVYLARERHIAVIAIMHFNKKVDITNALLRISNSLAFGGVARHVFSITDDVDNDRKLMARAKNNIAAKSDNQTLGFYFDTCEVGSDPESLSGKINLDCIAFGA
jgi:DNA polymerase